MPTFSLDTISGLTTRSKVGAVMAVCGMCCGAGAQPAAQGGGPGIKSQQGAQAGVATGEKMPIPIGKGRTIPLTVANPNAYQSVAFNSENLIRPVAAGSVGYTVYGEVVLIADSRAAAAAGIDSLKTRFSWLSSSMLVESTSLDGVFSISTRSVRNASIIAESLKGLPGIQDAMVNYEEPKQYRTATRGSSDPALSAQWHIQNLADPAADHNIQAVHDDNVTGEGVVVGVLEAYRGNFTSPYDPDDLAVPGYDYSDVVHDDLFPNFNRTLSQITDPFQLDVFHETSVAGLIGAAANTSFGRGVAFNAGLAALRNGSALETSEAWAHQLQQIDLINNSWGPRNVGFPQLPPNYLFGLGDDDFEVEFPTVARVPVSTAQELSIERALKIGRNKDGRVFVFAAGNEGHFQGWPRFSVGNAISLPQFGLLDITGEVTGTVEDFDVTGADTFGWRYSGMIGDRVEYWEASGHPFTFAIAAVGENNVRAGYSTTGTAVIAAAYSEGGLLDIAPTAGGYGFEAEGRAIATTSPIGGGGDAACPAGLNGIDGLTCSFNGTSAAAPIATGIFALMLDANPSLSVRDIQHIIQRTSVPINFDPAASYWTNLFGYGTPDPDDQNIQNPTFWQVNSGDVLHSDEYGFGVLDAEAAVDMARTWPGVPRLYALSSGLVTSDVAIPDATFEELGNIGTEEEPKILFEMVPGEQVLAQRELPTGGVLTGLACIRENYLVETVEITVTVSGGGAGDLLMVLESPRGSVSPIAIPRADSSGVDTGFAYDTYKFSTYKHWGELSGGLWDLRLQDFRPDTETPEGTLPSEDDPGEEHVTLLGPFGMPGGGFFEHTEKTLVSFEIVVYGTSTGLAPTLSCPPLLTSCPGDLNGDGIVDTLDLQIFVFWYLNGDLAADLTGDGVLGFADVVAYQSIWIPGFCNNGVGFPGGRPSPGQVGDNDPIIRPI